MMESDIEPAKPDLAFMVDVDFVREMLPHDLYSASKKGPSAVIDFMYSNFHSDEPRQTNTDPMKEMMTAILSFHLLADKDPLVGDGVKCLLINLINSWMRREYNKRGIRPVLQMLMRMYRHQERRGKQPPLQVVGDSWLRRISHALMHQTVVPEFSSFLMGVFRHQTLLANATGDVSYMKLISVDSPINRSPLAERATCVQSVAMTTDERSVLMQSFISFSEL